MKNKRLAALLLALGMTLSLCACGEENTEEEKAGVAVQVETVASGDISTEHRVTGSVSASDAATVYVEDKAVCTAVYVHEGQQVKAGDKLFALKDSPAFASYNAADATYLSTVGSYFDQQGIFDQQITLYRKLWNNAQQLYNIGAASRLEVEQAELQYKSTVAQRDATLAQVEQGLGQYKAYQEGKSALEQDENGNVLAPFDGTVDSISLSAGQELSGEYPVAVLLSGGQMKVTSYVSESLVPRLKVGGEALVKLSAIGAEAKGTIRSVSDEPNQQTRLYVVSVELPDGIEGIASGLFADITFYTDTSVGTVMIPSEAILTSNGTQYVFIVENDTAKYVAIETGLVGDGVTEVTAGLKGGETIVTVGQQYLADGDAVRIVTAEG